MARFSDDFRDDFERLLRWRRDVRRFTGEPVDPALLARLLSLADLAPSVGLSQPWRFVLVRSKARRALVLENFRRSNAQALAERSGERAALYARLKLSGLDRAPEHVAVFCVDDPAQGDGLGRATMPETVPYSAAMAIHTLWLASRAAGLGLGWVSILDPAPLNADLDVPRDWRFVAYLCLGHPETEGETPELERAGWEARSDPAGRVIER